MSTTSLITGGAGFIGTNLCKRLLKDGKKVICVDNLFTGKMRNIEPLRIIQILSLLIIT